MLCETDSVDHRGLHFPPKSPVEWKLLGFWPDVLWWEATPFLHGNTAGQPRDELPSTLPVSEIRAPGTVAAPVPAHRQSRSFLRHLFL